jgi:hypothetical protein
VSDQDINDLLKVFDNPCHCYPLNVVEAIRLLVKQRDEARRDLCMSEAIDRLHDAHPNAPVSRCASIRIANEIAVERGWDCFKEGTEQC